MGFLSRLFGGSQEQKSSIPAWLEQAGQDVYNRAQQVAGVGFIPYRGPDVAAITPLEQAAQRSTSQMAGAFGMPKGAGDYLPATQTSAGGVRGYSSAPGYDAAVAEFKRTSPEQYAALMNIVQGLRGEQTGNTGSTGGSAGGTTGVRPAGRGRAANPYAAGSEREAWFDSITGGAKGDWGSGGSDYSRAATQGSPGSSGGSIGNYTGLRDMFDGGGPGAQGARGGAIGAIGGAIGGGFGLSGAIAGGMGFNSVRDMFDGGGRGASGRNRR
jgi:hypothetical protein